MSPNGKSGMIFPPRGIFGLESKYSDLILALSKQWHKQVYPSRKILSAMCLMTMDLTTVDTVSPCLETHVVECVHVHASAKFPAEAKNCLCQHYYQLRNCTCQIGLIPSTDRG